jgi:hypothetical protein
MNANNTMTTNFNTSLTHTNQLTKGVNMTKILNFNNSLLTPLQKGNAMITTHTKFLTYYLKEVQRRLVMDGFCEAMSLKAPARSVT